MTLYIFTSLNLATMSKLIDAMPRMKKTRSAGSSVVVQPYVIKLFGGSMSADCGYS